jgi:acyl-coenzyme A thioesterase PaaI-like protein
VTAAVDDGELVLRLRPQPPHLQHGSVRASVHAFLIDLIAGLRINIGNDSWTLTTDLTVHASAAPAPDRLEARATMLRQGRRNVTWLVDIRSDESLHATGAASFITLDRRDDDPAKPDTSPEAAMERFANNHTFLTAPLREEAGIEVVDPASGTIEVTVTHDVLNTNGTMQGAMVALAAESAAEDLIESRFGVRAVVTDLDVRYLNRVESGRIRSTCRLLGNSPTAPIEVQLHDIDRDRATTLVYARATIV